MAIFFYQNLMFVVKYQTQVIMPYEQNVPWFEIDFQQQAFIFVGERTIMIKAVTMFNQAEKVIYDAGLLNQTKLSVSVENDDQFGPRFIWV